MTMIPSRSARSLIRRAAPTPTCPPAKLATAITAAASQRTGPKSAKKTAATTATISESRPLQRVQPLQRVLESDRQDREQHDPEPCSEIAAVDRGGEVRRVQPPAGVNARAGA